jgi:hypothetical protein
MMPMLIDKHIARHLVGISFFHAPQYLILTTFMMLVLIDEVIGRT